jgi:nitrate/TMAO reductase-like tetraheme cytochrome c subunit
MAGASSFAQAAESLRAAPDSFSGRFAESPLPGGVAEVVRFLFSVPQWIQVGGAILGVLVALLLLVWLWRRRRPIWQWIVTRPRSTRIALAAGAAVLLLVGVGAGATGWNYMQHDNGFCTGCHVMGPAYQKFVESEHQKLSCHNCHQQSIFASTRQLYFWVADRPMDIRPHSKVPDAICEQCHDTGRDSVWQHVKETAGHRTHLESDSSALRDVKCVTCHGLEVHRFLPVDSTCGQAGCHIGTQIGMGRMAEQTELHCATCHQFTAEVPRLATRDSAAGTLRPGMRQCFGCHAMQAVLADFDPARDPHGGTCGTCHNPHTQRTVDEPKRRCATSGCHDDWRAVPFHLSPNHRSRTSDCTLCHVPHRARVDASDCAGCHREVQRRVRRQLPLPFDTTRAMQRISGVPPPPAPLRHQVKGKGDAPPFDVAAVEPAPADTFEHRRHQRLACITCHTVATGRGRLTFERPRGCQICHHQAPLAGRCAACHAAAEVAQPRQVTVTVAVDGHAARPRSVPFDHETHAKILCATCHATPVTLTLPDSTAACASCHEDHHGATRACAACHAVDLPAGAHAPPVEAHAGCDACHTPSIVALLVPDRPLCGACHASQARDHYPQRECTVCHLQTSPEEYRARLRRAHDS